MGRIFIDGSSSAYGTGAGIYGGWADLLKHEMIGRADAGDRRAAVVTNFAQPLRTVTEISEHFSNTIASFIGRSVVNIAVLQLGLAESRITNGELAMSVEQFKSSLNDITASCREHAIIPILLGITPHDEERTKSFGKQGDAYLNAQRRIFDLILQERATDAGILYVDTAAYLNEQFQESSEMIADDGLHINAAAHDALHRYLSPIVTTLLHPTVITTAKSDLVG